MSKAEVLFLKNYPLGKTVCVNRQLPFPLNQDVVDENTDNTIRSELIRWVLMKPSLRSLVPEKGITIEGAKISGPFFLSFVRIPVPLEFKKCCFDSFIDIIWLEVPFLSFEECVIGPLFAEDARIGGDLILKGIVSVGEIRLLRASIGKNLDCSQALFLFHGNCPLYLEEAKINGALMLEGSAVPFGKICLYKAKLIRILKKPQSVSLSRSD
ncbi:hypothetical protein [Methylacidiphilum caldifontis]|uniref:hypothetical protein n=1 Tax=Methylacidiphilum caldifontis TaxID=2795386 RepID=UPI00106D7072|nr:hypothetical protein [Methylacidiphilum caldifontis]